MRFDMFRRRTAHPPPSSSPSSPYRQSSSSPFQSPSSRWSNNNTNSNNSNNNHNNSSSFTNNNYININSEQQQSNSIMRRSSAPSTPSYSRTEYLHALQQKMHNMESAPTISFCQSYAGEFDMLSNEEREASRKSNDFETSSRNAHRNRYTNILSNEKTRVRLQSIGPDENDYINANRVSGYNDHPGYIATQAPLMETTSHFWQMVYETGTPVIIMLTREYEDECHVSKSEKYWPPVGQNILFNDYLVEGIDENFYNSVGIIERRFYVGRVVDKRKKHAKDLIDAHSLMTNNSSNSNSNNNPQNNDGTLTCSTVSNSSITNIDNYHTNICNNTNNNSNNLNNNNNNMNNNVNSTNNINNNNNNVKPEYTTDSSNSNNSNSKWQTPGRCNNRSQQYNNNNNNYDEAVIDADSKDLMNYLELVGPVLEVVQLQYIDWPDQDVPSSPKTILDLCRRVDELSMIQWCRTNAHGPPIIHCSAGVGRTGTFIAIDRTLRKLYNTFSGTNDDSKSKNDGISVDEICDLVRKIKKERSKMVQTPEQYRFIYLAVLEGMKKWEKGFPPYLSKQQLLQQQQQQQQQCNGHVQSSSDRHDNNNTDISSGCNPAPNGKDNNS